MNHHTDAGILCSLDAGIATLTLNRPDIANAFDDSVIAELLRHLRELENDSSIRVLVLRGAGKHFSAGADLNWMRRMASASYDDNLHDAQQLAGLMQALRAFPAPTLAVVQGAAMGGAVGLISCCDIAIASDDARFALSEVRIGLAPAVISPYVIAAIGERAASRYFLTGEMFNASTAQQLGLLHEVHSRETLAEGAQHMIDILLANGPQATRTAKQLIAHIRNMPPAPETIAFTTRSIARLRVSAEGQEGMTAFLEKRNPGWKA